MSNTQSTTGLAQRGDEAKSMSQVQEQLGLLRETIEETEKLFDSVYGRICKVLRSEPRVADVVETKDPEALVPLAAEIKEQRIRLDALDNNIRTLLSRIEL